MGKENEGRFKGLNEFFFTWRIENTHLFWQETGEYLASPTFKVDWLKESSWNLCLYPKGIHGDDKYMSYFIAQENKNGSMDNIEAKFELFLLTADGSNVRPEISVCFLSMQNNGMLGWSRFISWNTLLDEKSNYLPDETLTLCCRIWCECILDLKEKEKLMKLKAFARTRIRKEVITRQMAFDFKDLYPNKIGEIRPILQKKPILEFNVNLDEISEHKSLSIDIDAQKNEKIKFAICDILVVNEDKRIFWKNKYFWYDIIKWESIVLSPQAPENTEYYVSDEMFDEKCLYLACQFVFTTGAVTQKIEKNDYGNSLDTLFEKRLSDSKYIKQESECQTAADALKSLYDDPIFHDVTIKGKHKEYKVHEMVIAPRSETFKKLLSDRDKNTNIVQINNEDDDTLQRVIYFLYTDKIQDMHWELAKKMYKAATRYKIELLRERCCAFIKKHLNVSNVCDIWVLKNPELKEYIRNFIIENHYDVFGSVEWSTFAKSNPTLALEYMMARFKQK